jgi:hypothetical protein
MEVYKRISDLAAAIACGDVPTNVVSPGDAAAALNISRQALHGMLKRGTLRAWKADYVIVVDAKDVQRVALKKRGAAPSQKDLYAHPR